MDVIHVSQFDGLQQVFGIDKQLLGHPHTLDRVIWGIQTRSKKTQTGVSQALLGHLGHMEESWVLLKSVQLQLQSRAWPQCQAPWFRWSLDKTYIAHNYQDHNKPSKQPITLGLLVTWPLSSYFLSCCDWQLMSQI